MTPWGEPAHCAKTTGGKNTTDDDIPERGITDCTNNSYDRAIADGQGRRRPGGGFPLSGIVHLLLRRIFLPIPAITLRFFFCLIILAFSQSRLWRHTIFSVSCRPSLPEVGLSGSNITLRLHAV